MRWFGLVTYIVKSYRRLKKQRLGTTTLHQKLRRPRRDLRSLSLILRFILYLVIKRLTFSSLSGGNLASILAESSSKPMNVVQVVAYSVVFFLWGHLDLNTLLGRQITFCCPGCCKAIQGLTKSSKICTMWSLWYLSFATHSRDEWKPQI